MLVARKRELSAQLRLVELLTLLEEERIGGKVRGRSEPVERRCDRNDEDIALSGLDVVQGCQTLRDQVLVGRELIIGQRLPVRQQMHPQFRRKERDLVAQPLGVERLGAKHRQRTLLTGELLCCLGEHPRVPRSCGGGPVNALGGAWEEDAHADSRNPPF